MNTQMTVWIVSGFALLVVMWWGYHRLIHPFEPKAKVKGDDLPIWPFEPIALMTDSEVRFYGRLVTALPELLVLAQVSLSRIIEPSEEAQHDRNFWFNRISRQSVDYVIVAQDRQTVLLVIELDDWTHGSQLRQKQDQKKDKALASAGIAVMRYHADSMPDISVLRTEILTVILHYNDGIGATGAVDD